MKIKTLKSKLFDKPPPTTGVPLATALTTPPEPEPINITSYNTVNNKNQL